MASNKKEAEAPAAAAPGSSLEVPKPKRSSALTKDELSQRYDMEDLGQGVTDLTATDLSIPFLTILQKGSPQVDENGAKYVKGAKAGMLLNTVTQELYDGKQGVRFIPVDHSHDYIEFIPRDQGGGFVGKFSPSSPEVQAARAKKRQESGGSDFGTLTNSEGNELKETFSVPGLLLPESDEEGGMPTPVIIAFASSQIKHYKNWMTSAYIHIAVDGRNVPLPLFAHVFRIRTKFEENKHGSWMGFHIRFDTDVGGSENCRIDKTNPYYGAAKSLRAAIIAGTAKADYSGASAATAEPGAPNIEEAAKEL